MPSVLNSYFYVEIKVVIHDTTGSVAIHVDEVAVTFNASLTGIDTRNAGTTGIVDRFVLNGSSVAPNVIVDDLYLCDDSGSTNNDFLGICAVERLMPETGNGDHTDFTCSTGSDHGALVDDNPPTDDTDYNSSTTVGHQDCYHYPSLCADRQYPGYSDESVRQKNRCGRANRRDDCPHRRNHIRGRDGLTHDEL